MDKRATKAKNKIQGNQNTKTNSIELNQFQFEKRFSVCKIESAIKLNFIEYGVKSQESTNNILDMKKRGTKNCDYNERPTIMMLSIE